MAAVCLRAARTPTTSKSLGRYAAWAPSWAASGEPAGHTVLTELPAASMPCGVTAAGLPIGLQLVAARGREHLLAALASAVERTLP